MTIEAIRPASFPWFRYDGYSFSLGLTDGTTAWLSGHSASAYDPDARRIVVRGAMAEQATTAYAKILAILQAAGLDVHDVVHIVENLTVEGVETYSRAAEVRTRWLGDRAVPVTTRVIDHLLRPDALIEIEVKGRRGGTRPLAGGLSDAGGTVHLPMMEPVDEEGRVVGAGDAPAQYRYCLQRALDTLAACGLGPDNVVQVVEYLTPGSGIQPHATALGRRELLGPVAPAGGAIGVRALRHADAMVAVEITASTASPQAVDPGWALFAEHRWSPAVVAGDTVYLSTFTATDPTTGRVEADDVVTQAETAYTYLESLLTGIDLDLGDLVETVEFVARDGLPDYRSVAGVRQRQLREPWPASTGIVCDSLPDGALFSVLPTALLRSDS